MTEKLLQLMQELDQKQIDTILAYQCAPLITGLKCSNLLILKDIHGMDEINAVKSIIKNSQITLYTLYQDNQHSISLLYKEQLLSEYLKSEKVSNFLINLGYRSIKLSVLLSDVSNKYYDYKKSKAEFPHEIGLLLNYPVEDVYGFMKKGNEQCLCNGYWKVYDDVLGKIELFHRFDLAKEVMAELIAYGISMQEIVRCYCG